MSVRLVGTALLAIAAGRVTEDGVGEASGEAVVCGRVCAPAAGTNHPVSAIAAAMRAKRMRMHPSYGAMAARVSVGRRTGLVQESLPSQAGWATHPPSLVWYNRIMNASRGRGAALIAALLVFVAVALSPPVRPYVRQVVYALHLRTPARPPHAGQPLGTVVVSQLDGVPLKLRPRPGHALLINVFTTWCPSCRSEAPYLARLAARLAKRGTDVVGIDQSESASQVERFAGSYGLQYPIYIDPDGASRVALDARVIPTTLLIDRHGVIRFIHVGPLDRGTLLAMTGKQP
jgi:thiol-disulfide isomerase/thioredoxin